MLALHLTLLYTSLSSGGAFLEPAPPKGLSNSSWANVVEISHPKAQTYEDLRPDLEFPGGPRFTSRSLNLPKALERYEALDKRGGDSLVLVSKELPLLKRLRLLLELLQAVDPNTGLVPWSSLPPSVRTMLEGGMTLSNPTKAKSRLEARNLLVLEQSGRSLGAQLSSSVTSTSDKALNEAEAQLVPRDPKGARAPSAGDIHVFDTSYTVHGAQRASDRMDSAELLSQLLASYEEKVTAAAEKAFPTLAQAGLPSKGRYSDLPESVRAEVQKQLRRDFRTGVWAPDEAAAFLASNPPYRRVFTLDIVIQYDKGGQKGQAAVGFSWPY